MAPPTLSQQLKDSVEASKAEYRYLGTSGLRVSVPIFGCMSFGDPTAKSWEWTIGEEEVRRPGHFSPPCPSPPVN
jgi:hypothetical protein